MGRGTRLEKTVIVTFSLVAVGAISLNIMSFTSSQVGREHLHRHTRASKLPSTGDEQGSRNTVKTALELRMHLCPAGKCPDWAMVALKAFRGDSAEDISDLDKYEVPGYGEDVPASHEEYYEQIEDQPLGLAVQVLSRCGEFHGVPGPGNLCCVQECGKDCGADTCTTMSRSSRCCIDALLKTVPHECTAFSPAPCLLRAAEAQASFPTPSTIATTTTALQRPLLTAISHTPQKTITRSKSPWRRAKEEAEKKIKEAEGEHGDKITARTRDDVVRLSNFLDKMKRKAAAGNQPPSAEMNAKLGKAQEDLRVAKEKLAAVVQHENKLATDNERRLREHANFSGPEPVWAGLFEPVPQLSVTWESCLASLEKKAAPKSLQRPLWIHFPKAGTTFATTMYSYLCTSTPTPQISPKGINCTYCGVQGKTAHGGLQWDPKSYPILPFEQEPYCDWDVEFDHNNVFSNHFPLPGMESKISSLSPIALFRDPRKRLVSAWNNNKHSYGISGMERKRLEKEAQTLKEFIAFRGIPSCQTKMLTGKTCGNGDAKVTSATVVEAKHRLADKMAFVGLTEMFNASVCLFHHMYGGLPKEYQFQPVGLERSSDFLFNHYHRSRKYLPLPGGGERVHSDSWKEVPVGADKYDWEIYVEVVKTFAQRLQNHGLMGRQTFKRS